jgi:hypothetical protein
VPFSRRNTSVLLYKTLEDVVFMLLLKPSYNVNENGSSTKHVGGEIK